MNNADFKEPSISDPMINWLARPFQEFIRKEISGGILLIFCTVIALIWANLPSLKDHYIHFWHQTLTFEFQQFRFTKDLHHWINDGLMVIFFFVVGLEIKREMLVGELASFKRATLPIIAALGGMLIPAGIYLLFNNPGSEGIRGWGIPMATDIAFAIGALALLGKRVPVGLKVFLVAVAIVDDLGAVLVIAIGYTDNLALSYLGVGFGFLFLSIIMNLLGVRHPLIYGLIGIGLWLSFLSSGVHAAVAGVLLAITIPSRAHLNTQEFFTAQQSLVQQFSTAGEIGMSVYTSDNQRNVMETIERNCIQMESPMHRLERGLHPWVTFIIMPVFALANAGVYLEGDILATLVNPISLGIILGLVIGKQIGITLFSWFAVKLQISELPRGVTWGQFYGVSWLGGIGFTMSIFIANLAFPQAIYPDFLMDSKLAILVGSIVSGLGGWLILRFCIRKSASVEAE